MTLTVFPNGISVGSPAAEVRPSNALTITVDFASATWNTQATHEILTVTGLVRVRILPVCTENLAGATATLTLGVEGAANAFIASTTGTDIDAGELWIDATPTTTNEAYSTLIDRIVYGVDIGYEIGTAALTDGTIVFYVWWDALSSDGNVTAGAGGTL